MKLSGVTRAWLLLALSLLASGLVAQTTSGPADRRPIDWKKVIPAVASDQKRIWTFPLQPARGKHWVPVLGIAGVTGAMITADPHEAPYFRRTGTYKGFNTVFSGRATHWGTVLVPVSLYAAGLIRKDSYQQKTALLAGVAAADTAILTVVMKGATSRLRPRDVPAGGDYGDTWFQSKGNNWLRGHGSFPSGHTMAAFSVATVISRRYPQHRRWLPYVAYGLAGVVGFSRVTLSSHFPSEVFAGAALGYTISRYAVLR
jgi:membrane-associated phospholipid phosphatase